eukprot:745887-Hanusia_phi.AAC.1
MTDTMRIAMMEMMAMAMKKIEMQMLEMEIMDMDDDGVGCDGDDDASASSFSTLCYSADGKCLIAGGNTKWVCIYNIARKTCIKKFAISSNQSLDGILEQFNTRNMTEAGPLNEIDHDRPLTPLLSPPPVSSPVSSSPPLEEEREDARGKKDESLPGARRGQLSSSRKTAKAIRSTCLRFSPTGRAWAAATTEGLLIYSLDETSSFDPLDLDLDITPARIYKSLEVPAPAPCSLLPAPCSLLLLLLPTPCSLLLLLPLPLLLLILFILYCAHILLGYLVNLLPRLLLSLLPLTPSQSKQWLDALLMALRLNEASVLRSVYERIPKSDIPLLVSSIPPVYIKRMLELIAAQA